VEVPRDDLVGASVHLDVCFISMFFGIMYLTQGCGTIATMPTWGPIAVSLV
jgi:hypothetical protein